MAVEISASTGALYPGLSPDQACEQAAVDGFTGVEFWALDRREVMAVERAVRTHGLVVTSVNAGTGSGPDDFGLLAVPSAVDEWRRAFAEGLGIARRLRSRAVNLLVGGRVPSATRDEQLDCARRNLDWAVRSLHEDDPLLLLEPLNGADRRSPVLRTVDDVLPLVAGRPQLGILFDAYHLHQEEPDLLAAYDRALPAVRHVQVADHPGRGEPGTGNAPLSAFLEHLRGSGYDGWVGAELTPSPGTTPADVLQSLLAGATVAS